MFAREVMTTCFHCLKVEQSIAEAVTVFREAGRVEKRKIFGMMVTDESDHLVGMFSMYDILLFIRPKHVEIFGEMDDLPIDALFSGLLERVKKIRVGDIMSTELVTVKPETPLMIVVDLMIRKHVRRLPVVENEKVTGIIYRSDLFDYLMSKII